MICPSNEPTLITLQLWSHQLRLSCCEVTDPIFRVQPFSYPNVIMTKFHFRATLCAFETAAHFDE